jgi:hypothetical protein
MLAFMTAPDIVLGGSYSRRPSSEQGWLLVGEIFDTGAQRHVVEHAGAEVTFATRSYCSRLARGNPSRSWRIGVLHRRCSAM